LVPAPERANSNHTPTTQVTDMPLSTLLLEELTWPEVEAALGDGYRSIVVAVGAIEQHGPALPLSVDAERGTRLALEVAQRLNRCLVAPTIRVGCSEHHMEFPGTLTLSRETLQAICTDYVTSLVRHGFANIYFVPSHGGNFEPLQSMLDDLDTAAGDACRVDAYLDLIGFVGIWTETIERVSGLGARVGGHADIAEASEVLVVRPDLVRMDRAEVGRLGEIGSELLDTIFRDGFRSVTANGVLGDTRGASAEIGVATFSQAGEVISDQFIQRGAQPSGSEPSGAEPPR
jgi:creatinine amidohydrolase